MEDGQTFNPFQLFTGIFVPEWLARSREVSAGAKLAYGRLARYAGQQGLAYPSVATLATEIGYDIRQTQRYLAELEQLGLIRRVARVSEIGQTSNLFEFLWQSRLMSPGPTSDLTPPPTSVLSPKESHIEESHSEITTCASDDARPPLSLIPFEPKTPDLQPAWFAEWWNFYWLKKSKKDAWKVFKRVVKTEQQFKAIMDALQAQIPEMLRRDPDKRPYGATWLNGERWQDEIESQSVPARPKSNDLSTRALGAMERNLRNYGRVL